MRLLTYPEEAIATVKIAATTALAFHTSFDLILMPNLRPPTDGEGEVSVVWQKNTQNLGPIAMERSRTCSVSDAVSFLSRIDKRTPYECQMRD